MEDVGGRSEDGMQSEDGRRTVGGQSEDGRRTVGGRNAVGGQSEDSRRTEDGRRTGGGRAEDGRRTEWSERRDNPRHADLSTKLDPKRMLASSEALLTRIQQSAAAAEIAKDEAVTRAAAAREATADIAPLLTALKELREETRQLRTDVAEIKAAQDSCCVIA